MNERRRQYYTDQKLQGTFLVSLILMEVILVSALIFFLYFKINQLIENNLYNIHNTGASAWPEIFILLGSAMGFFVIINLLALYIAHLIWSRYVNQTIADFSAILDKISRQDFSDELSNNYSHHHMIELMKKWYRHEKKRQQNINQLIEQLDQYKNKDIDTIKSKSVKQILDKYRQQLINN